VETSARCREDYSRFSRQLERCLADDAQVEIIWDEKQIGII